MDQFQYLLNSYDRLLEDLILEEVKDITQNPNFKSWFSGSKVVDQKGNPLPVFRGFRKVPKSTKHGTTFGRATPSYTHIPEVADVYAKTPIIFGVGAKHKKSASVGKYYISMKKPLDLRVHGSAIVNLWDVVAELPWDFNVNLPTNKFNYEDALNVFSGLAARMNRYGEFKFESTASDKSGFVLDTPSDIHEKLDNLIDDVVDDDKLSDQEKTNIISNNIEYALESVDLDAYALADSKNFTNILKRLGYDGIIHKDVGEGLVQNTNIDLSKIPDIDVDDSYSFDTFRPFDITQVKSAYNKGTFNPSSRNVSEDEYEGE